MDIIWMLYSWLLIYRLPQINNDKMVYTCTSARASKFLFFLILSYSGSVEEFAKISIFMWARCDIQQFKNSRPL